MTTPAVSTSRLASRPAWRGMLNSRDALCALFWMLTALVLAVVAYKRLFPGELIDADAMDYAQIARNIATGHGFSTGILRPLALTGFVSVKDGLTPDISHAPLYPFLLSLMFAAHGGHGGAVVVVLTSLFFFLLSAWGVYVLARTLLPAEGQWLALLATGLYMLGGAPLGLAASGLPVTLATLLVSGLLIALHRAHEVAARPALPGREALVGVMLGLCFLAQYSLLLLALPTALYVFVSRSPARAWRGVGLCALGFFAVTGAWLVRMAHLTGNPFFTLRVFDLMSNTPDYPGPTTIYRGVLPADSPFAYFFSHGPQMLLKAGQNLSYYQLHGMEAFSLLVLTGALASLLWRFGDIRLSLLRGYVFLCLFAIVLVSLFFAPSLQIIVPFAPALTVLAVAFAAELMRRQDWQPLSQRVAFWVWGLLAGVGLLALFCSPPPALNPVQVGISMTAVPPLAPPYADLVRRQILAGAVITDTPWELTWRTERPAVWLPRDNQTYEALIARSGSPGKIQAPALLLTPNIVAYNDGSSEGLAWLTLGTHVQAWRDYQRSLSNDDHLPQQIQIRAEMMGKMIDARDPRITLTRTQLAQQLADAQATMPARIRQARQRTQQQFVSLYGPVSEIMQDYTPAAVRAEVNGASSTLFVRRTVVSGAGK